MINHKPAVVNKIEALKAPCGLPYKQAQQTWYLFIVFNPQFFINSQFAFPPKSQSLTLNPFSKCIAMTCQPVQSYDHCGGIFYTDKQAKKNCEKII